MGGQPATTEAREPRREDDHLVRTAQFGPELREWRTRRRWSQLELAERAGTTQRHLSYIESGRSAPGRGIVLRLAEALELTLRERNELLLAAGFAPVFAESQLDGTELQPVLSALDRILRGHLPYPALITRPYGNLVAANTAIDVIGEGAEPYLRRPPVNIYRLALHPDGIARRIENLPEWGRHVLEILRAQARRSPDPALDEFIAELERYVPPLDTTTPYVALAVPLRLRSDTMTLQLVTTLAAFATTLDITLAELQLIAFLPADAASADLLRRRAEAVEAAAAPPGEVR